MPLNINDEQEAQASDTEKPRPILRGPAAEPKSNKKVLLLVFGLVVVGAAVFLVYLFFLMKPSKETARQPAAATPSETAPAAAQQPAESGPSTTPPVETPQSSAIHGAFTIFIASYLDRSPAEEEVGRWKEAGYEAFVVEASGHYRVAVGAFARLKEARSEVAALSDGFEHGYWIGKR